MTIGMRMLANLFASVLALHSLSLTFSKSAIDCCSWVNTLMTLLPSIISSMKPFTSPSVICCSRKYLPERRVMKRLVKIMTAPMKIVISVSGALSMSMEMRTNTIIDSDEIICGRLCEMSWRSVSVSLVYTDMISPWAWVSK